VHCDAPSWCFAPGRCRSPRASRWVWGYGRTGVPPALPVPPLRAGGVLVGCQSPSTDTSLPVLEVPREVCTIHRRRSRHQHGPRPETQRRYGGLRASTRPRGMLVLLSVRGVPVRCGLTRRESHTTRRLGMHQGARRHVLVAQGTRRLPCGGPGGHPGSLALRSTLGRGRRGGALRNVGPPLELPAGRYLAGGARGLGRRAAHAQGCSNAARAGLRLAVFAAGGRFCGRRPYAAAGRVVWSRKKCAALKRGLCFRAANFKAGGNGRTPGPAYATPRRRQYACAACSPGACTRALRRPPSRSDTRSPQANR